MTNAPSPSQTGNTISEIAPAPKQPIAPVSQEKKDFRKGWPVWAKQLPRLKFNDPNPNFQLIDRERLRNALSDKDSEAVKRIESDLDFLERELLRLFRSRDHEAAMQQNRYRLIQLGYIALAALATLFGSLQAMVVGPRPDLLPLFAFFETVVALLATFLATISNREPPLTLWLNNRRRAENLRREYYRYIMHLPPYDKLEGADRRILLSSRAADINRGVFPDDVN
jgi:hypothetical protein